MKTPRVIPVIEVNPPTDEEFAILEERAFRAAGFKPVEQRPARVAAKEKSEYREVRD